jgi:hypothetical protein
MSKFLKTVIVASSKAEVQLEAELDIIRSNAGFPNANCIANGDLFSVNCLCMLRVTIRLMMLVDCS